MFDIGEESKPPITGIVFHKIPQSDKYVIIVTTLIRIYQYVGTIMNPQEKPLLQQIFSRYLNVQGIKNNSILLNDNSRVSFYEYYISERFNQLESSLPYSRMQVYYPVPKGMPTSFGWLSETGILYAEVCKNI